MTNVVADTDSRLGRPHEHHPVLYLKAFWHRAYRENVTGLAGMVAYNLLFALFPFALLILFVVGQVIRSSEAEMSILLDLQRIFPAAEEQTLSRILDNIRDSSTTIGVAAIVGALWVGTSFWGAMDTAFCRIYHVQCRGWVQQKRWSLVMLVALTLLLAASVIVPSIETAAVSSADDLPLGLSNVGGTRTAILIVGGFVVTFAIIAAIYWAVPKGHMPWRSVWPGSLFFALVTSIGNYIFPIYLSNVSDLHRIGGTIGFILVAMVWFYAIALAILAGAVINSLRHEQDDTGVLPLDG